MKPSQTLILILRRWGFALLVMALIFAFSSIPSAEMPRLKTADTLFKKLGHVTGYALLSYAYVQGLGRSKPASPWLAIVLAVLYAVTDELHQSFTPGRNASVRDVGIDAIGAVLGVLPHWFLRKIGI